MHVVGTVFEYVLYAFIVLLWIRFIVDWIQIFARSWEPRGVLLVVLEVVYSLTDPPIKGLRKVIKPIRFGNFSLDVSFLIVMILAYVLLALNRSLLLAP